MTTFREEIEISVPVEKVWEILGDIGAISRWNPGVVNSHLTSDKATGLGTTRRCELGGKNYVDEDVVEWEPNKHLTMRITATNLPFKRANIRFTLKPQGDSTIVTVSPDYKLKFRVLGVILDSVFVRRTYAKVMRELLNGLKEHAERDDR